MYYDSMDYYYPFIGIYEHGLNREVVSNVPKLEFDGQLYRDSQHRPFLIVSSLNEFELLRKHHFDNQPIRKKHLKPEKTPILAGTTLFYPIGSLTEYKLKQRSSLEKDDLITYDTNTFTFVNTKNQQEYVEFVTEEEFELLRNHIQAHLYPPLIMPQLPPLDKSLEKLIQSLTVPKTLLELTLAKQFAAIASETPIFLEENMYYYPESALFESLEAQRIVLTEGFRLIFDYHVQKFVDPITEEKYMEVTSTKAFKDLRDRQEKKTWYEMIRSNCDENPIFMDETKMYYYPIRAVYGLEEMERNVVNCVTAPLVLDEANYSYYSHTGKVKQSAILVLIRTVTSSDSIPDPFFEISH